MRREVLAEIGWHGRTESSLDQGSKSEAQAPQAFFQSWPCLGVSGDEFSRASATGSGQDTKTKGRHG
jgi:hypothetical protein